MRQITPDPEKSKSLLKMSQKILERINETDEEKYPAQVLKDYYDILHQLIEAIANLDGMETGGPGAHQNLINWYAEEYEIPEEQRKFLQQLRQYRNRISYEGFFVKPEYIKRNNEKIQKIIKKLKETLKKKLP